MRLFCQKLAAGLALAIVVWAPARAEISVNKALDASGRDVSGDRQTVIVQRPAPLPLAVQVSDKLGRPVSGVRVVFSAVGRQTANLEPDTALSDARGYALCRVIPLVESQRIYVQACLPRGQAPPLTFELISQPRNWWLISLFGVLGGLAVFLFGIRFCSRGLQKAAGAKLKQMLWGLTDNRFLGLGIGILVTAIIQSSTATSIMLVSLANAGLLNLGQVLGVILGADIGTTITVQLIAFKLSDYCLVLVAGGFLAMMAAGKKPWRYYPQIIFGFGLIFYGMKLTADSLLPLRSMPWFLGLFSSMDGLPLLGLASGILLTLLVKSSAVTIGILLTLSFQDLVSLNSALPVLIGANIGTCGAALMAAWGGSREAAKVAWAHTVFKLTAGLLAFAALGPFVVLVQKIGGDTPRQIANAHTLFNLLAAFLFLPFLKPLGGLLEKTVPKVLHQKEEFGPKYLDERALETPSLAIGQVAQEILRMADLVRGMLSRSFQALERNDMALCQKLVAEDDKVDLLQEAITPFVAKIAQEDISSDQSSRGVELLYILNDIENIGDVISKNIMGQAGKKIEHQLSFSPEGLKDIARLHQEVLKTMDLAIGALASGDRELAYQAHMRKDQVLKMEKDLYKKHLERLQMGLKESRETSTLHLDLLGDFERINFHASQIGAALLGRNKPNRTEGT